MLSIMTYDSIIYLTLFALKSVDYSYRYIDNYQLSRIVYLLMLLLDSIKLKIATYIR